MTFRAPVPRLLAWLSVATLAVRLAWVVSFREIDSDSYGHFFIAIATRRDPTNIAVHWVWLPLFHLVVGAAGAIGLTFRGVRVANAVLAGVAPLLLYGALARGPARADVDARGGGAWAEDPALLGAAAFAIAPLTMVLGQSAQPEMLFTVLLVASMLEAAREHAIRAGVLLALASLVRYEAWGGAFALFVGWAVLRVRRAEPPPFALVAIPAGVVAAYVAFRWWTDGQPLVFLQGTRDITSRQVARAAWTFREVVSFPIVLPCIVLGPTLALVPLGMSRAFPRARDALLPLGLAGFLLLSYYSGGSHAGERYLVSLLPFACAAIGAGIVRVGRILGRPRTVAALSLVVLALTTGWHLHRAARMAIAWDDGLREREAELTRLSQ